MNFQTTEHQKHSPWDKGKLVGQKNMGEYSGWVYLPEMRKNFNQTPILFQG